MFCQECGKKPATLHFTKIVNGEKTEFHICESCAREKGEFIPGTPNSFSIHHLLSGLLDFEPTASSGMAKPQEGFAAKTADLTYTQFGKLGRFGCSFVTPIFPIGSIRFSKECTAMLFMSGKCRSALADGSDINARWKSSSTSMKSLVEREEFEEAAKVRDQIRDLERKLAGDHADG